MKLFFIALICLQSEITWGLETNIVSFPTADGGAIFALYEPASSAQGVVLGHGAVFDKNSWSMLTKTLNKQGISVLALDFRGYGKSTPGTELSARYHDILAGVRYLKEQGVKRISVLGASMGGGAAAIAASKQEPGQIDKLILLSPVSIEHPEHIKSEVLYIASQDEAMVSKIQEQFDKVTVSKQLKLIPGKAHAQHIFNTEQKDALSEAIVNFLIK